MLRCSATAYRVWRLLFTWLVNSIALGSAAWLVGDVRSSSYLALAAAGLVFAVISTYLKPVLVLLGIPFIMVTLGIGLFLINMLMVWLTAALVPGFDAERLLADRQGGDRGLVRERAAERVLATPRRRRSGLLGAVGLSRAG